MTEQNETKRYQKQKQQTGSQEDKTITQGNEAAFK
jgi:hypothetical protein